MKQEVKEVPRIGEGIAHGWFVRCTESQWWPSIKIIPGADCLTATTSFDPHTSPEVALLLSPF